jgi:hypothetical protein
MFFDFIIDLLALVFRWFCYGGRRSYIILLVAGLVQSSGQPLAYYQHRPYPSFPPFVIVFRAIKRGGYTLIYKLPHLWVINNAFAIA